MTTAVHPRIVITVTWRYCVAFYCVIMLWASNHELVHHFTGFLVCGAWGTKTFNSFSTACEGTPRSYIATYIGPLVSFGAMWLGWWFLRRARSNEWHRQLGFAMIFAQLPLQRMTGPFFHHNDEYYATALLFGGGAITMWTVAVVIWMLCVPPLVGAWRGIGNRRRAAWFLFYLVLFPYLVWGPFFGGLEYLLTRQHLLAGRTIGIANLFVVNEVVTVIGYWYTRKWLAPAHPAVAG